MTGKPSLKCLIAFLLLLISCSYSFAQERVVSGQVKDPQGNPLPGVSVSVWGTRQSVTADVTGSFSIPVRSEDAVLVFSFVGFLQKEVKVGKETTLSVTMAYDNADLDQVVVVGYGTSKRRDLTGSIYSVKPSMVTATPSANPLESLQGRIPGLEITRSSGAAGAGTTVLVRGTRTFGNKNNTVSSTAVNTDASPLYIIDGFQGGSVTDLNPNDIESIEVLRDASATAIYGWMGANGVIIVTTKRGKDRPKVSYSGYYGVNGYASYPKARMGESYVQLRRDAFNYNPDAAGVNNPKWNSTADDNVLWTGAGELAAWQAGQWVDWQDLLVHNGTEQSHTVSIQSGGDKTKVFFSTGYYKEEGMLRGNDYTRFSARLNFDQRISNSFKAGLYNQITYTNQNSRPDPLNYATATIAPLGIAYDDKGQIVLQPLGVGNANRSPLGDELPNAYKDNTIKGAVSANGYIEFTPITGLSIRSNLGTNFSFSREGIYADSLSYSNYKKFTYAKQATIFTRFYNWDNIVTYAKKIMDHSITLTGITSYTRSDRDDLSAQGNRQVLNTFLYYNLGGSESNGRTIGSGLVKYNSMSYAGRINYTFKGKYLFTASIRADGVSRLSPGHKWDYFPSAALGWNIHQEDFMSGLLFVNNLKLRASYGVAGNASINPYGTQALVTGTGNGGGSQNFGDVPAPGYWFNAVAGNPNLGWEKTATYNLGLDFALLKSRLYGTIDAYKSRTSDILFLRTLPYSTGFTSIWQNIGESENKGLEVVLSSINMNNRDFRWTSTLTYTTTNEKITKLVDGRDLIQAETNSLLIGRPINSFYSYKKLGIWQKDEATKAATVKWNGTTPYRPGDIKVADLDGNDSITNKDLGYLGSSVPKWYAGLQNTFTYKGFELSVYVYARWGQMINATYMGKFNSNGLGNGPANFNYWTPDNPTNDFPRPRYNTALNNYYAYQSLNFIDGSFIKLKTITFGYTLPVSASRKVYAEKIRIYATANNVITKTKSHLLKDYEPERNGSEDNPLTRQFVLGVNAEF